MKAPIALLAATLTLAAAQDPPAKLFTLTTTAGRTYSGATITKVEPDGLRVTHESGTAKIPFEKLPEELRIKYGYDPAKAAEFKKKSEKKLAEQEHTIQSELDQQAREAAAKAKAQGNAATLAKAAKQEAFIVSSVGDDGLLVNRVIVRESTVGNSNGNGSGVAVRTSRSRGTASFFVVGYPHDDALAEDKIITGKFAEQGSYTFEDDQGIRHTVEKFIYVSK